MIRAGVRNVKDHVEVAGLEEPSGSEAAGELVRERVAGNGNGKPIGLADAPRVPGRRAQEIVVEDRR